MGAVDDLTKIALSDFGRTMAITMSTVHGLLIGIGIWKIMQSYPYQPCASISTGVIAALIILSLNVWAFFKIVGNRAQVE
jgi:hypothetical protein